jgi:hypothetical protein
MGYEPTAAFKDQSGSLQQVKAVVAAAAAPLGNTIRVLYVSPTDAEARMPEATFQELAKIKNEMDKKDEQRGPSSATRGAIGTEPVWRPFDETSTCAFRFTFRPAIILQDILEFAGRNGTDVYGLGFNGDTADRDARPAPAAMEDAVRSMCALFPSALEGLIPFSYTLAKSTDDSRSEHGPHKDPRAYHGVIGLGMYGVVEMRLHHPSPGFAANVRRLDPHSVYLMAGQAAFFCKHSVTAPLTPEGRCVLIVRFIPPHLFEPMKRDMVEAAVEEED